MAKLRNSGGGRREGVRQPEGTLSAAESACALSVRDRQELVLRIARAFDAICRKHGIWYTLTSGSILGAVRHSGFIPWDPDMDVLVMKDDVPRLRAALKSELPADMRLFVWEEEPRFPDGHDSISIRGEDRELVRFDIFTIIGVPASARGRRRFVQLCFWTYRLFYCKHRDTRYSQPGHVRRVKAAKALVRFVPDRAIIGWYRHLESKYPLEDSEYWYTVESGYGERECLPKAYILETCRVPFEDAQLSIPVRAEDYLEAVYGNWREPLQDGYKKLS